MKKLFEIAIAKYILMYYDNTINISIKIKTEKRIRHLLYKAYVRQLIGNYTYDTYTRILPFND